MNIKLLIVGLLLLSVSIFAGAPLRQTANFAGKWESNTNSTAFLLTFTQDGNSLTGSHCSVMQSGNRIDCGLDQIDLSITGTVNSSDRVTVEFTSFYKGAKGKALVKKLSATSIEWTITEKPSGEFYIPAHAVLTKQ